MAGGTRPVLVFRSVQMTNTGSYQVWINNAWGQAMSQTAELVVDCWLTNASFGRLCDVGGGWYWSKTLGWLSFSDDWVFSSYPNGWLGGDGVSGTLWSTQFKWLSLSGLDDNRAYTTTMGWSSIGDFGGWVWNSPCGWIWVAGDGVWFYSDQYGWLGVTEGGGIWCVNLGRFL